MIRYKIDYENFRGEIIEERGWVGSNNFPEAIEKIKDYYSGLDIQSVSLNAYENYNQDCIEDDYFEKTGSFDIPN